MSTINLVIGGVDVGENVEVNTYRVHKVWKNGTSFTKFDGSSVERLLGYHYEINVSLTDVPDKLMRQLTSALDNNLITVKFSDPHADDITEADFVRSGQTGGEVEYELADGLYWGISISLKSKFVPFGGGL